MLRLLVFVLIIAVATLFLIGRPGGESSGPATVAIHDLQTDPEHWEGKQVRVSGTVGARVSVLGFGGFTLTDENGHEVVVIGHTFGLGQSMTVEGRLVTAFAVGDTSVSFILVSRGEE